MTTPTRHPTASAAAHTMCSICLAATATHLITTQDGACLVCATCRPIDLIPVTAPTRPASESSRVVTR